jgi:iron complex outermembrane receptor protein
LSNYQILKIIVMQKIVYTWFFLCIIASGFAIEPTININKSGIKGKVTDHLTGEVLPGVTIYFTDLKTGTISKSDGTYSISNLPSAKVLVQVSFIGYQLIARTIDLSTTTRLDFALEPAITEISEIVVTGQSGGIEKNRTPAPITIIPAAYLTENSATNVIDALARIPGVSQITTGGAISKPVIRGLGYNRVIVVNDGIRQEGQQWGDEHGIEIDEFSISRAEILKGPASLAYGSDAMAGVINLMSAPILPEGIIQGNLSSNFQTNNGLFGNSLNFAGNKNGLIWNLRASDKRAHAYKNRYDGLVYNSGFTEDALSGIVGINRSWGFSHLHLSMYQLKPGIVEGTRDSITGQFVKPDSSGNSMIPASSSDFKSYQPDVPFQLVNHYKAVFENSIYLGSGNLKATLGFQQNRRKEYADFANPDQYELYFLLNTLNYNFQYTLAEKNNFNISFGLNGMAQKSENKGEEFLVPAYTLFDAGIFAIAKKSFGKLDLIGGLRADRRQQNGEALFLNEDGEAVDPETPGAVERFAAFDQTFTGVSGSIGTSYQISKTIYTKLNVARGYRAPNIGELGSNGVHEGTLRYEIGNSHYRSEY